MQSAFQKNPASLFASILHCAELGLNPSELVGEFFFIPFKNTITPIIGYKGLITLLYRSNKIKKVWTEVVFDGDDFEYELGINPKLTHIPSEKSVKKALFVKKSPKKGTLRKISTFSNGTFFWRLFLETFFGDFFT